MTGTHCTQGGFLASYCGLCFIVLVPVPITCTLRVLYCIVARPTEFLARKWMNKAEIKAGALSVYPCET